MTIELFDANMSDIDRNDGDRLVQVRTTNSMNELYFWCDADDLDNDELVDEIKSALRRKYGRRGSDMYVSHEDVTYVFFDEEGRRKVDEMPPDHWDSDRGHSHCTGWQVRDEDGVWWYEFEDARTGETFLAK